MIELRPGKSGAQLTIYNPNEKKALVNALFDGDSPKRENLRKQFQSSAGVVGLEWDRAGTIAVFADTLEGAKSAKTELEKMAKDLHQTERKAEIQARREQAARSGLEPL